MLHSWGSFRSLMALPVAGWPNQVASEIALELPARDFVDRLRKSGYRPYMDPKTMACEPSPFTDSAACNCGQSGHCAEFTALAAAI